MTDTTEAMRAAFEKWAKSEFPFIALGKVGSGTYSSNKTRIMWHAWQAALVSQQVPEGYKLVPINATDEMRWAGQNAFDNRLKGQHFGDTRSNNHLGVQLAYEAMLAAAPAADREGA